MAKRRNRPKTPQQIAEELAAKRAERRDADKRLEYGVDAVAMTLPQNQGVVVVMDKRRDGKVQTARRGDVFDRLCSDPQLKAVRRLEGDIAEQTGQTWRPGQRVTVDACAFPPGQNVSQLQVDAGGRVKGAITGTGARCGWLLHSLIVGIAGKERSDWRGIVEYITGEKNEQAQGARVRAAADNLAAYYGAIPSGRQKVHRNLLTA